MAATLALVMAPGAGIASPMQPEAGVGTQAFSGDQPAAWTYVSSKHRDTSYWNSTGPAPVGRAKNNEVNRSFFRYDIEKLDGKRILSATLLASRTEAVSCDQTVELWVTGPIKRQTTWDNQPTWHRMLSTGAWTFCPGGMEFDATGAFLADQQPQRYLTLGLRVPDETNPLARHVFENNPVLIVEYNTAPGVPTELTIFPDIPCASGDGRPAVGTETPTLLATTFDEDEGDQVAARFAWETLAGDPIGEQLTTAISSGVVHQATIPAGQLADGGLYRWRVRAEDTIDVSDWSQWCEFRVDTTRRSHRRW